MKYNKNRRNRHGYEDEDEYEDRQKKKDNPRRRSARNLKKAWDNFSTDYIDNDDFFRK